MNNIYIFTFIVFMIGVIVWSTNCKQPRRTDQLPASYVNPFIGTGGYGHTYPGATVPFGMVQVSPDNGKSGWDYDAGYHYPDNIIAGFSMTHSSGMGVGDFYDFSFMPFNGTKAATTPDGVQSLYSHKNELAEPGYYHVQLNNSISVDLTSSPRVGFYRYGFPDNMRPGVSLDLGFSINQDSTTASYMHMVNDTLVTGYRMSSGWVKHQRVYFAAAFSRPITEFTGTEDGEMRNDASTLRGRTTHGFFFFNQGEGGSLLQKVAISAVSIDNARLNLRREAPGWNFGKMRTAARASWNRELGKVTIQSDNKAKKCTFYTALYHSMLGPTLYMDANGQYRGADGQVHRADGFQNYTSFSFWDTYRAEHSLLIFLEPRRVNGFVQSLLAFYEQHGLLPKMPFKANTVKGMIAYHVVSVIAEAYLKGFRGYDAEKAFEAMKKTANELNKGVQLFNKLGYVPSYITGSVSKTLEYAYDDWCIAQVARALGKDKDYKMFAERAQHYRNIYDTTVGFMRPKLESGEWKTPFDPLAVPGDYGKRDFIEANAWQYLWYVPQNVPDLIRLMGGEQAFVARLDSLFTHSGKIHKGGGVDITGRIGQYVQGNEPDQQVPYLYDYAGVPWKTQRRVRTIMDSLYTDGPVGLPGNDDVGQMSAWYVFSALGLYPVNPASGIFAIGSPTFPKAMLHLHDGKTFTIRAHRASRENIYIQSATLNGTSYDKPYIRWQDIAGGGTLTVTMGNRPNKQWGTQARPPQTAFGSD